MLFGLYDQDEGQVYMEWRDDYPPGIPYNNWAFPGGKVDPGDGTLDEDGNPTEATAIAALRREAREELDGLVLLRFRRLAFNTPLASMNGMPITAYLVWQWLGTLPPVTDKGHRLAWRPLAEAAQSPHLHTSRMAKRLTLSALRPPPGAPVLL